jgi:hypothetical protein
MFFDKYLKKKKIIKTLDKVKDNSTTRKQAFETYVTNNVQYTNDGQNVLDSAVNEQLRRTWKQLQKNTPVNDNKTNIINVIRKYIIQNNSNYSATKQNKALIALEEIQKDNLYGTLGASGMEVCSTVWRRSDLSINEKNKSLIKDAIVDSLSDMITENGHVVCFNGRCARLLESLVLTDVDDNSVIGVMTLEQIRNDVFQKSNEILQETIKSVSQGHGSRPDLETVAKSYIDPLILTDKTAEKRFKELVKGKVDTYLQQTYADRLSDKDYNNIRDHCIIAIDTI